MLHGKGSELIMIDWNVTILIDYELYWNCMYMSLASAHHDLSACVYFMLYFITGVPHIYGKLFHSIHFFSEEHGTGLILGLLYHPIWSGLAIWI